MEHTKEEIQKKFEALPNDVREAISSVDTSNIIVDIGEKYELNHEQIDKLIYEENRMTSEQRNKETDEQDEFLDREKVLNEIENPLGDHGHVEKEKSIVENKLEGVIKMPMAEKEIKEEGGIDPYREAV